MVPRPTRYGACLLAFAVLVLNVEAASWYVATNGLSANSGTLASPWDLKSALTNQTVVAGDTLYVLGGTYTNTPGYVVGLTGTITSPITVQPLNKARVTIDGIHCDTNSFTVQLNGTWTTLLGLEITDSNTSRPTGSSDPTTWRPTGIAFWGINCKVLDCIIHDNGNGIVLGQSATNAEIRGCVIYNNGWPDTPYGRAHGIYAQSDTPNSKIMEGNVLMDNFGLGIQCYASSSLLLGFQIDRNISYNNGIINTPVYRRSNIEVGGSGAVADNVIVRSNRTYHAAGNYSNMQMGFSAGQENGSLTYQSNYVAGGYCQYLRWTNLTVGGNYWGVSTVSVYPSAGMVSPSWDNNTYFETSSHPFFYQPNDINWATWLATTSWDASSSYTQGTNSGTRVFVDASMYTKGRGNVTVYNWDKLDNVSVDISPIAAIGSPVVVRNAQDYYGAIIWRGRSGTVTLPMTNLMSAAAVGVASPPPVTGPEFNVFVVEPDPNVSLIISGARLSGARL